MTRAAKSEAKGFWEALPQNTEGKANDLFFKKESYIELSLNIHLHLIFIGFHSNFD